MAGGAQKWLVGCGVGCGILILAAGGIGTCSYVGFKKIKDRADGLDAGFDALYAEYGRPAEFTPPADGAVPAGRMETFLAVRAAMAASRDELAAVLTELDADTEGVGGVFRKIGAGMSILPRMLDFIDERNLALSGEGMGVGEYLFIYSLAYYAWLGKDPADGPSFTVADHEEDDDTDDVRFRWKGDGRSRDDPEDVREQRGRQIRSYLNRIQRRMLSNQLDAARGSGRDAAWIARLEAEQAALAASPVRLMWEDDLPDPVAAGLEPYRDRLEETYAPVMNVIEVGLVEHE